jgi:DNA-binding LacI/PurR family transcriptional regulator
MASGRQGREEVEKSVMGTGRKRVTVADVAREAGVSSATVSYVLNDAPNQKIPPATRERVHEAVAKLGYTRSAAARALSRGRSDTVLLVLPDLPISLHFAQLMESLTDDLGKEGLIFLTHQEQPHRTLASLWREVAPAAVIAWRTIDPAEERAMRAAGVYVAKVVVSAAANRKGRLVLPNEVIGHMQASHLAATGHRHLGYAAPTDDRLQHISDMRLAGVRAACREQGMPAPVVEQIPPDVESTASTVSAWRRADPSVTAVCAYNDDVAFVVLAGMRALGLEAPRDLAVIGVDNIPTSGFACPPLTTIDQDISGISAHLTRMVSQGIAGKRPPRPPFESLIRLIVRESA